MARYQKWRRYPSKGGVQAPGTSDKSANGKPRFEFYNMLPNAEETITEQQLKQAAQQPVSKDKYFLQADLSRMRVTQTI